MALVNTSTSPLERVKGSSLGRLLRLPEPATAEPSSPWPWVHGQIDPQGCWVERSRSMPYQQYVALDGATGAEIRADKDSAVLAIAPSGSGKTSSLVANGVSLAPGPVVSLSGRSEPYRITALGRARLGMVWGFLDHRLPGAKEVRFSILQGCKNAEYAERLAHRWLGYKETGAKALEEVGGSSHFRHIAAQVLWPLLFAAATMNHPVAWVRYLLISQDYEGEWKRLVGQLRRMNNPGARLAAAALNGCIVTWGGERSGQATTAAISLEPFADEAVVRAERGGDFDFDAFVRGEPQEYSSVFGHQRPGLWLQPLRGRYDSVYIPTGDAESKRSSVILEFLWRVKRAMYDYTEELALAGEPSPIPVTLSFDELAAAPVNDIAQILAESRDRGFVIAAAMQSLAQADVIYGQNHDFASAFQTLLVYRGIKHQPTLDLLSKLAGKYWAEVHGWSQGRDHHGQPDWNRSVSFQERERLSADRIAVGHPAWADGVLRVRPGAQLDWVRSCQFFKDPFARLLINSAEHAYANDLQAYPPPPLVKDGDTQHLDELGLTERYRKLLAQHS